MLKPTPFVPIYYAESVGKAKEYGASKPLSMVCAHRTENGDIQRNEYVVKFFGDATNNQRGLARELIASLLGQVMGFEIPTVGIIEITQELCDAAVDWHDKICKSVGLNFGSMLVSEPYEENDIPRSHLPAASQVFAFDMLIQNVDRNTRKCNWFRTKTGYILFDHEKTFMCAEPFQIGDHKPWLFENPKDHICFPALKTETVSFDEFIGNLKLLTDDVIDAILARVPDEWRSKELPFIRQHLVDAREGADQFKRSLQEVVA